MAYATEEQLAEYLGIAQDDLPDDAERLLDRASELIDYYTMDRIDETDDDHMEAAQLAACGQVEFWEEAGDELGTMTALRSISIGSFSAATGSGSAQAGGALPELAHRARQSLFLVGLLYRGVQAR